MYGKCLAVEGLRQLVLDESLADMVLEEAPALCPHCIPEESTVPHPIDFTVVARVISNGTVATFTLEGPHVEELLQVGTPPSVR